MISPPTIWPVAYAAAVTVKATSTVAVLPPICPIAAVDVTRAGIVAIEIGCVVCQKTPLTGTGTPPVTPWIGFAVVAVVPAAVAATVLNDPPDIETGTGTPPVTP